jgi:hypothetical protein
MATSPYGSNIFDSDHYGVSRGERGPRFSRGSTSQDDESLLRRLRSMLGQSEGTNSDVTATQPRTDSKKDTITDSDYKMYGGNDTANMALEAARHAMTKQPDPMLHEPGESFSSLMERQARDEAEEEQRRKYNLDALIDQLVSDEEPDPSARIPMGIVPLAARDTFVRELKRRVPESRADQILQEEIDAWMEIQQRKREERLALRVPELSRELQERIEGISLGGDQSKPADSTSIKLASDASVVPGVLYKPGEAIERFSEHVRIQDEKNADRTRFYHMNRRQRDDLERQLGNEAGSGFAPSSHLPRGLWKSTQDSFTSYHSAQSSLRGVSSPATNFTPGFYSARKTPFYAGASNFSPASFRQSPAYYSAKSSYAMASAAGTKGSSTMPTSEYIKAAQEKGLILPLDQELNWSGKENGGQHVEFAKGEELPFQVLGPIGASLTATVDKVRCRRILLARKTMICGRRLSVEEALVEVEHLQKLRHPHIIQLVGSYLQGKKFSVLLYPVADCDLSVFLDEVFDCVSEKPEVNSLAANQNYTGCAPAAVASMWSFFGCLADAIRYIHFSARKHLDIKPGNILVKKHPDSIYGYRVYIADFGISRSFRSLDHSQTDTAIRRTPKYCAPEVWDLDVHGRAADIFSLGCVFMEMLTVLCGRDLDDFADFRSQGLEGEGAYHESIERVSEWAETLRPHLMSYELYNSFFMTFESADRYLPLMDGLDATLLMLQREPEKRKLPIFNRGEPEGENCHTCGEIREVYREEP